MDVDIYILAMHDKTFLNNVQVNIVMKTDFLSSVSMKIQLCCVVDVVEVCGNSKDVGFVV